MNKEQSLKLKKILEILNVPVVDVELAVYNDFQNLYTFLAQKNKVTITTKANKLKQ